MNRRNTVGSRCPRDRKGKCAQTDASTRRPYRYRDLHHTARQTSIARPDTAAPAQSDLTTYVKRTT